MNSWVDVLIHANKETLPDKISVPITSEAFALGFLYSLHTVSSIHLFIGQNQRTSHTDRVVYKIHTNN